MKEIIQTISSLLPFGPMDAVAVGIIDFNQKKFEAVEAVQTEEGIDFSSDSQIYFDLASVSKPLINSLSYFLKPEAFDKNLLLCLNHRAGIPAWGLLSKNDWKKQIMNYPIVESETLYSDFSAIRVMLELEKKGINQKELVKKVWDPETVYWTDLPVGSSLLQYGFKEGHENFGIVHDPNAYTIGEFVPHAGVFSTINGLCRTLLNYEAQTGLIQKVKTDLSTHQHRFAYGWDRVMNPSATLAGKGCGPNTFGHLGFTGTSVWIDPDLGVGHVILTNTTKNHWFDKANLNDLRRGVGELVWRAFHS